MSSDGPTAAAGFAWVAVSLSLSLGRWSRGRKRAYAALCGSGNRIAHLRHRRNSRGVEAVGFFFCLTRRCMQLRCLGIQQLVALGKLFFATRILELRVNSSTCGWG